MRPRALVGVLVLVLANLFLLSGERSLSRQRRALDARLSEVAEETELARIESERRRRLEALVSLAATRVNGQRLGIAPVRTLLLAAERGLALERISLDFRPQEGLPKGVDGNRIRASLRGTLGSLYTYLERIEAMHLPFVTEVATWHSDGGTLSLTIRWSARFSSSSGPSGSLEISPAEDDALAAWLRRGRPPGLGRDLFSFPVTSSGPETLPDPAMPDLRKDAAEAKTEAPREEPKASGGPPELLGFVLARPELEPDVARRVLVVLRFEDRAHLLGLGDRIGDYVVEGIEARESVTLANARTGEQIVLRLP